MSGLSRRALLAMSAYAATSAFARTSSAMGRTPIGGKLAFKIPFAVSSIDPHDLRDPAGALFGAAISDALFGLDPNGIPYPMLAQSAPTREGDTTVVKLREGLRSSRGIPLDGKDLAFSVERARARGANPMFVGLGKAVAHKTDALAAVFQKTDPGRLARALACPLVTLVPRTFDPAAPDGTGAFRADIQGGKLVLTRNPIAARGASFLDSIEVESTSDLKTSLRDFEAERDDLGWLGMGLHGTRKNAVRFDLGRAAWVVLSVGPDGGTFAAPGVAQKLCDAFPSERLAHLGLGALPTASGDPGWGGPVAELVVDESSAFLVEVARAVAPILSRPGHEVTATPIARAELARRVAKGKATLAIDLVRPLGISTTNAMVSLACAEDAAHARDLDQHPPKLPPSASARALTSGLRVGVLGEARVAGGSVPDVVFARATDGWDLGATWRRPKK